MGIRRKALFVAFAGTLLAVSGALAATKKIAVRAWDHTSFGRISFDWGEAVKYNGRISDGKLIVRFAKPFEADFSGVMARLGAYVRNPKLIENGRAASFDLVGDFRLRTAVYGSVVAVDLLRDKVAEGPRVKKGAARVRVGDHPGFGRAVIDWTAPVAYRVTKKGTSLVVEIRDAGSLDLGRLKSDPPRNMTSARTWERNGRRIVDITVPAQSRYRYYADGKSIVVDVLDPANAAAGKSIKSTVVAKDGRKPAAAEKATKIQARLPVAPASKAGSEANKPRPLLGNGLANPAKPGKAVMAIPPPARPATPQPETSARALAPAPASEARSELVVQVSRTRAGIRLGFPWKRKVPAAIFNRADVLWTVFGQAAKADFRQLTPEYSDIVKLSEQVDHERATVLRFGLRPGMVARVSRQGTEWVVELEAGDAAPVASTIAIRPEPGAVAGARVFFGVPDAAPPLAVNDPLVGDRLLMAPVFFPSRGVPEARGFVEFDALRTAQGVVVAPRADGVSLTTLQNGVVVSARGGLTLSRPDIEGGLYANSDAKAYRSPRERSLYDFATWRRDLEGPVVEVRRKLQAAISDAPVTARNLARLDLARFHLAHGFGVEALGVLDRMAEQDAAVLKDLEFLALRGAARIVAGQFVQGEKDLKNRDLAGRGEVNLWRGLAAAAKRDWPRAEKLFSSGEGALQAFPEDVRGKFLVAWARAALETGNPTAAGERLDRIASETAGKDVGAEALLLRGRVEENTGRFGEALKTYQEVVDTNNRPTRARAEAGIVRVKLAQGVITPAEAIDSYEKLRYAWRGDDFELNLLRTLGRLYFEEEDYRNGLESMRQAVVYYPDSPLTAETAKTMSEQFARLFLEGKADSMTAIKALGLYYDFRELTPVGTKGDLMIAKLADRLVSVDLLDQAAKLLDHQVKFRLRGVNKAKVAARLAVIRLLDRKPEAALNALRNSRVAPLPAKLDAERARLEARALADLGRLPEALESLKGRSGPDTGSLRADIYWQWKKWPEAAAALDTVLGERWKQQEPLDDVTRYRVMQQAISYSLANDRDGLERVRKRYQAFFKGTQEENSFQVITARVNREGTDFRELASTIAQVNQFEAFMVGYREKIRSRQLSAIN